MSKETSTRSEVRVALSRERVLQGALEVADTAGLAALTMRSLAESVGVKPMSLYHYVAGKEDILDGIVDSVFSEIELPTPGGDWRAENRKRARSAREVLRRHPWATALMQSRTSPGPATLRHHNAVIRSLREAGFSVVMTAHAFALLDSYINGFALSETSLPINGPETVTEVADSMMHLFDPAAYPHLLEFTTEHVLAPGYDYGAEFEYGLDLLLDGLQRAIGDHGAGAGSSGPHP